MAYTAWIALGSNLGNRKAHLDSALSRLASVPGVALRAVSAYQETAPVGGPAGQEPFLNAAAGLVTTLSPHELLAGLHAIEDAEGRERTDRWGARTLDLDLVLCDQQTIAPDPQRGSTLAVPHPWLPFRRFVLAPLAEIAATAVDPITGQTVAALLANLDRRPGYIAIDDPDGGWGDELYQQLVSALNASGITCSRNDRYPPASGNEIGRLQSLLRRENRFNDRSSDAWIVSNFWYPRLKVELDMKSDANEPSAQRLHPTFVVGAAPIHEAWSRGTPRLKVDPRDPSAALEKTLAACAASRS